MHLTNHERLKIQLLLKDFTQGSLSVTLRLRLSGPGIILQNEDDFISAQSINLTPGVPVWVSGADIDNLLQAHLLGQGIDIAELYEGKSLPAGLYR